MTLRKLQDSIFTMIEAMRQNSSRLEAVESKISDSEHLRQEVHLVGERVVGLGEAIHQVSLDNQKEHGELYAKLATIQSVSNTKWNVAGVVGVILLSSFVGFITTQLTLPTPTAVGKSQISTQGQSSSRVWRDATISGKQKEQAKDGGLR
jgi:hypothetical protein